jgi:RNA polymerase sigma-70 factor (ECF subfamily)
MLRAMADPRDDGELLDAWREGDEKAGRELFARHFDAVFRFFRNKVESVADDLTQQTFLGAVRGKDRFRGQASFRTYLFTIARNRLYTFYRDRQRSQKVIEVGEKSAADLGAASPTGLIAQREEQKLLLRALRHLPLDMQVALELHYWEHMTVREIAEVTETPEGTIKRRLQRARSKLDALIAELADSEALRQSTIAGFETWARDLRAAVGKTKDDETA